jgi:hypothetical protein
MDKWNPTTDITFFLLSTITGTLGHSQPAPLQANEGRTRPLALSRDEEGQETRFS